MKNRLFLSGFLALLILLEGCAAINRSIQLENEWQTTKNIEPIINALQDESSIVRGTSIEILGKTKDPRAVEPLIAVLKEDKSWQTREKAAEALGEIKDPRAVEPLIAVLKEDKSLEVRENVICALGRIGDPRAAEALFAVMDSDNKKLRLKAIRSLGLAGGPRAAEALLAVMRGDNKKLRLEAFCSLAQMDDASGVDALLAAIKKEDNRKVFKALMKGDAKYDVMNMATVADHPFAAGILLANGADPDMDDSRHGYTPLVIAIFTNHPVTARVLIARRAAVNARDTHDRAPVMSVAITGDAELLEYLLDSGAEPNLRDKDGYSALMWAAEKGNTEVVRLLLRRGADPSFKTRRGKDALALSEKAFPETAAVIRAYKSKGTEGTGAGQDVEPARPRKIRDIDVFSAGPRRAYTILTESCAMKKSSLPPCLREGCTGAVNRHQGHWLTNCWKVASFRRRANWERTH